MKQETEYQPSTFKTIFRSVLMVLGVLSGFGIGVSSGVYYMQKEAIKHYAGGYDKKTGDWGWISPANNKSGAPQLDARTIDKHKEKQEKINAACKALGYTEKNDPKCALVGM